MISWVGINDMESCWDPNLPNLERKYKIAEGFPTFTTNPGDINGIP